MAQTCCEKYIGTHEEIEGERKEGWNEGDTGRRIGTNIFAYKRADTYKHASHTTVILHTYCLPEPTLLHTIVFYAKKLLHTNTFRLGTYAFTQTLLHRDSFAHKHFYTQTRLHTNPFTHKLFTHKHFYTQPFYTETLSYTDAFTHRPFRTQTLLHTNTFTHRRFYTERLLHRDANNWVTDVLYAKEKKMLQMISRKKIEMIYEDSKLKPAEVHRKSFICKYF